MECGQTAPFHGAAGFNLWTTPAVSSQMTPNPNHMSGFAKYNSPLLRLCCLVLHCVVHCTEVCIAQWVLGCYIQVLPHRLESNTSTFQQKAVIWVQTLHSVASLVLFPITPPPLGEHQPICILTKTLDNELLRSFSQKSEPF